MTQFDRFKNATSLGAQSLSRLQPLSLEPRFMFDAAGAATGAEAAQDAQAQAEAASATDAGAHDASTSTSDTSSHTTGSTSSDHAADDTNTASTPDALPANSATQRHEVALVDTSVDNYQELAAGFDPNVQVITFQSDGSLTQIADILGNFDDLDAVHLVSHGAVGSITLGGVSITGNDLSANVDAMSQIGASLSDTGDILLYGCDVGADARGMEFVDQFAGMTGADVAASNDATGAADLGGDWQLEVSSGSIETAMGLSSDAQASYHDLLASSQDFDSVASDLDTTSTTSKSIGGWTFTSGTSTDIVNGSYSDISADLGGLTGGTTNPSDRAVAWNYASAGTTLTTVGFRADDSSLFQLNSFDFGSTYNGYSTTGTISVYSGGTLVGQRTFDLSQNQGAVNGISYSNSGTSGGTAYYGTFSFDSTYSNVDRVSIAFDSGATPAIDNINVSAAVSPDSAAPTLDTNTGSTVSEGGVDTITSSELSASDNVSAASAITYTLSAAPAHGSLFRDANSNGTLDSGELLSVNDTFTQSDINGNLIKYVHDGSETTSDSLQFTVKDGAGNATATQTMNLTVTPVNDAPTVTNGATHTLSGVGEDATGSAGTTVSSVLSDVGYSDGDSGASSGLAVTSVTGQGTWQYSTDGAGWTDFGTVSTGSALLLSSTTQVRYVPDGDNGETATFDFRAWDQTSGTASVNGTAHTIDTSSNGNATSVSSNVASASISVSNVNDAPVLTPDGPTLTGVSEDATTNSGQVVSSILGSSISDVDTNSAQGLALTGLDNGNGKWQYSLDNGSTWVDAGTVSDSSALLLRATDKIRFVPNGEAGTTGSITYHAWDQTSGTAGTKVDATTTGGTAAFSTATDTANITVTDVNDAPTITNGSTYTLTGTNEDTTSGATTISAILSDASLADVDSGASGGIAITGVVGNGSWQYSTDGTSWTGFGSVSSSSALLLASTAQVRYVPDGSNGETATFSYRAWDQTSGTASSNGSRSTADTSVNGGSAAFSSNSASASLDVAAINDDPSGTGLPSSLTFVEDSTTGGIDLTGLSLTDVDAGSSGVTLTVQASAGTIGLAAPSGVTLTGNGTNTITITGTIANIESYLSTATNMTYHPDANVNGNNAATLSVKVNDNGNTGSGGGGDVALGTIAVNITAVNDAPVIGNLDGDSVSVVAGSGSVAIDANGDATLSNIDSTDYNGGSLVISQNSGTTNGAFSVDGSSVTAGGDGAISSGETISVGGVAIGTVDATNDGQGGNTLTIDFNTNATNARVQSLIRSLHYSAASGIDTRNFTLTVNDGDGTANGGDSDVTANFDVNVTPNPPVISGLDGGSVSYSEGDSAVLLDVGSDASISDADSSHFNGGNLTVSITAGGHAGEDLLSLSTSGNVSLSGSTAGSTVSVGGTVIGQLANAISAGNDLVVNFTTTDATPAAVASLLHAIQYSNSAGDNPTAGNRTVGVTITDAGSNAATSTNNDITVAVSAVNDAPVIGGTSAGQAVNDNATTSPFSSVTISEPEGQNVTVTVTVGSGGGSFTAASLTASGFTDAGGGKYTLASGSASAAQTAIRQLVFDPAENTAAPGNTTTTGFTIAVSDGSLSDSDSTTTVVSTSINDAPVIGGTSAGQTVNDNVNLAPFSGVTISDADHGDTVTVTVSLDDANKGAFTAASLSASNFVDQGGGVYTLSNVIATAAQSAIRQLSYNPADNRVAVGSSETTTFTVKVDDGDTAPTDSTTTVISNSVNVAPSFTGSYSTTNIESGSAFSHNISLSNFTDADGDTLSFSAKLADGSPLPAWLTFTRNGTTATLSGTAPATVTGDIAIHIIASDGSLQSAANLTLAVQEVVPPPPASQPTTPEPSAPPVLQPAPGNGNPGDNGTPVSSAIFTSNGSSQGLGGFSSNGPIPSTVTGQLGSSSAIENSGTPVFAGLVTTNGSNGLGGLSSSLGGSFGFGGGGFAGGNGGGFGGATGLGGGLGGGLGQTGVGDGEGPLGGGNPLDGTGPGTQDNTPQQGTSPAPQGTQDNGNAASDGGNTQAMREMPHHVDGHVSAEKTVAQESAQPPQTRSTGFSDQLARAGNETTSKLAALAQALSNYRPPAA